MESNGAMVDALREWGAIRTSRVEQAFRRIDRRLFTDYPEHAYEDVALPTRLGQTISAPGVVAAMLEWLDVRKGMNVLDVGSGSGYNAALLAELVGKRGRVVTVERHFELSELARRNVAKAGEYANVLYETGDGSGGWSEYAPYDRIIVAAAMPAFGGSHPLARQLGKEGVLVAPVGDRYSQRLIVYGRKTGETRGVLDVAFVPLVGKYGF